MERKLYRLGEVGHLLGGASVSTVRRWIRSGRLGAVVLDGALRVPAHAVDEFVGGLSAPTDQRQLLDLPGPTGEPENQAHSAFMRERYPNGKTL